MQKIKVWTFDAAYMPIAHEFVLGKSIKGPYAFVCGYEVYKLDFNKLVEYWIEVSSGTVLGWEENGVIDEFISAKPPVLAQRFKEGCILRDQARIVSEQEFWECVFLR